MDEQKRRAVPALVLMAAAVFFPMLVAVATNVMAGFLVGILAFLLLVYTSDEIVVLARKGKI